MTKEAKANSNRCHSNAIANPPTQILSLWPTYMCDEELAGPCCCTRQRRSEVGSMLVELETRRFESGGSGSIGSSFLWGLWPQIELCGGSGFRTVLDGWGCGGFGFAGEDFGISLKLWIWGFCLKFLELVWIWVWWILHLGFLLGDDFGVRRFKIVGLI